jgi:YggT family protein
VIKSIIIGLVWFYLYGVMLPRALLSWFPVSPGSPLATVNHVLYRLTEPVLAPVRRLLPPVRFGTMGIDLSFIIVFLGIQIIIIPVLYNVL